MYKIRRKVKIDGVVRTVTCKVIPERGEVVAELRGCMLDAADAFIRDTGYVPMVNASSIMNDVYSGTAHCHPEDTFDAEIGADIATDKMLENYMSARANKTHRMIEYLQEHLTEVHAKRKVQS